MSLHKIIHMFFLMIVLGVTNSFSATGTGGDGKQTPIYAEGYLAGVVTPATGGQQPPGRASSSSARVPTPAGHPAPGGGGLSPAEQAVARRLTSCCEGYGKAMGALTAAFVIVQAIRAASGSFEEGFSPGDINAMVGFIYPGVETLLHLTTGHTATEFVFGNCGACLATCGLGCFMCCIRPQGPQYRY